VGDATADNCEDDVVPEFPSAVDKCAIGLDNSLLFPVN